MRAQLVLESVGVRYPHRTLFEEVNWTLYEGMRVTLAGRNGCGKSTLMRILAGRLSPAEGSRSIVGGRQLKIGYLDQNLLDSAVLSSQIANASDHSVLNYVKTKLIAPPTETESAEIDWRIERVLSGLGFSQELMTGPVQQLSGGWLLRLFIGASLVEQPDLLLLDEPTNHLDLSSIQWLEHFLMREFKGSLILISHDIALQKRTTDSLAVLHGGRFYFHKHQKDYLSFRESLVNEEEILEKSLERTQKKHKEIMDFVNRFRAKARAASRAQSKLRDAAKVQEEINEIRNRLEQLRGAHYHLHFRFRAKDGGSRFPLVLENINFQYADTGPKILKDFHLETKRGQRIAIMGDNGAGKTTLLKVMAKNLKPQEGTVQYGHGVAMGFFGQHQLDELSLENTLLENLRAQAKEASMEQLRAWLGAFGFSGEEEVSKLAKVLSGGERARLALLRILVTPINLCLLDEPTNHLDIETKELLKKAILAFEGSVVFVSHDREFVNSIADRILYLSQDHQITDHLGNLDTFFEKYPERRLPKTSLKATTEEKQDSPDPSLSYEERKKQRNRIKSLKKKIEQLEGEIDQLGEEKHSLEEKTNAADFYDPENQAERDSIFKKIGEIEQGLTKKMVEWEKLSTELGSLE